MKEDNIIIIESEYEIIRPVFIKRNLDHLFNSEETLFQKKYHNKNMTSIKKEKQNDFSENDEKEEKNHADNFQENSIMEILKILNQPIKNLYCKNRYILEKDISKLYDLEEEERNDNNIDDNFQDELVNNDLLNRKKDNQIDNINFVNIRQQISDKTNLLKDEVKIRNSLFSF